MRSKQQELDSIKKIRAAAVRARDGAKAAGNTAKANLAQSAIDNCDARIKELEK